MSKILHKLPTSVLVSIAIATVLGSTIVQPLLFNSPLPIFSLIPNWILWMVFLLALLVTIYQAYLTLEANQAKFDLLPDDDLTNDFVGRKEQVDELTQLLLDLTTHPAIVICGMGGMGKTTLAEKVLHNNKKLFDYRVNFSFGKQMFEPVTGMMKDVENEASTTDAVLVKIARALGLPGITEKSIRTNEKKLILKEQLRGKRIIVFFDNIESEEMTNHVINDICSILSPASKLLITSRVVLKGERIRHLSLIGLSESESIALLKKNGNHIPSIHKAPRNELIKIHKAVNGCPLALKLVVGQLIDHDLSTVLLNLEKVNLDEDHERFYTFVFEKSWSVLNEKAKILIANMTNYYGPMTRLTSAEIISSNYIEKTDFGPAMRDLVRRSLVEKHGSVGKETYELHPLTHNFVRVQLGL